MTDFDPRYSSKPYRRSAGVYRMLSASGEVLYVGKARNLRKRVGSYFRPWRTQRKKRTPCCSGWRVSR